MSAKRQSVYRMSLGQFYRYLKDKSQELKDCYKEIEEVQYQFNDIFKRELADWQGLFGEVYPVVLAGRRELAPGLVALIDRTEQEELARLRGEIVELGGVVTNGRQETDRLLAEAQALTQALREANPEINDREERLKRRVKAYQDEYADAYEKAEDLGRGLFAGLIHAGEIAKLRRQQRISKSRQAADLEHLRRVRQEWLERVEETSEQQSALRTGWQTKSREVSQAQSRLEHLRANLDSLAEQAAIQRVLEELDHDPGVEGDLGRQLIELVQRNETRHNYELGLQAVAEALGLTKGVGEGMQRFRKSVGKVLEEQRRYSLAEVQVPLSRRAAALNQTWKVLLDKVRDEKYLGKHPMAFAEIVRVYVSERLTDENIQYLFESMGESLSQATAAWN